MSPSDVEYLSQKIQSALRLKLTNKGEPSYSGRALPDGKGLWGMLKKDSGAPDLVRELQQENFAVYLKAEQDGSYCSQVREHIRQTMLAEKAREIEAAQAVIDSGQVYFNDSIACPLSDLLLIENVNENSDAAMYDPAKDISYRYGFKHIERTLERKLGKNGLPQYLATNLRQAKFEYRPREDRLFKDSSGHWIFNTYNMPTWQIGHVPNPDVKELPAETLEYLMHLADDNKDTLQDILYWLKCALYSRAEHALVLRGTPGCGKNMLAERLAAALVGDSGDATNFTKATRGFVGSSFHAYLASARVVLIDEQVFKGALKQTVKDLQNVTAVLEEKNRRLGAPSKMCCSFIVCNNYKKEVHMEVDDRKFFVPNLSPTDLQTVKPPEWIDNLTQFLWKDTDYLRQIADYLQFRVAKRKGFTLRTPQFMELCWIHQPAYVQEFITKAVACKTFTKKDLPDCDAQFVTMREKVADFGLAHKIKGGVGVFVRLDKRNWEFTSHIVGRTNLIHTSSRDDEAEFKDINV